MQYILYNACLLLKKTNKQKTPDCSEQRESKTKKQQLQLQCENEELKSHSEDENKDKNQKCPYAVAGVA